VSDGTTFELSCFSEGEGELAQKCYVSKKMVKFTVEEATKAQKWSSDIAILFFNLGARWV
jgi:hypothetical protein